MSEASKRPSGGARATAQKHAAKEAARNRGGDWTERWITRAQRLGAPPLGATSKATALWVHRLALLTLQEAATDPGLPPEQRRREVGSLLRWVAPVLDKGELAAELTRFYDSILGVDLDAARAMAAAARDGTEAPQ